MCNSRQSGRAGDHRGEVKLHRAEEGGEEERLAFFPFFSSPTLNPSPAGSDAVASYQTDASFFADENMDGVRRQIDITQDGWLVHSDMRKKGDERKDKKWQGVIKRRGPVSSPPEDRLTSN